MSRIVSFAVLVGVIAVIGFLFYRVISGFLLPMFLAALLVVIFQPWYRWFFVRCKGRVRLAALLTTISAVVVVVVPTTLIVLLAVWELYPDSDGTPPPTSVTAAAVSSDEEETAVERTLSALRDSLESASGHRLRLSVPYTKELRYIEASLDSLRERAAVGATYTGDTNSLDNLREALGQLERLLVKEGDGDKLEKVEAIIQEIDSADGDPRTGETETVDRETADPGTATAVVPGTFRYQELLDRADGKFHAFKLALFKNPVSVWLFELLNPTTDQVRVMTGQLSAFAPGVLRSVGGKTGSLFASVLFTLCVTVIALYFFLADGPKMVRTVMRLSPLDDQHERELVSEFDRISRAVVLATLLSAIAQGLLAGVAFWLISLSLEEFRFVFSLTLLTTVLALIPFVGAAAVWAPVSLWLFFHEPADGGDPHRLSAILLAVYGAGIISMADNVIKPLVLHGQSNLHPLLALLSVLGGVQALGPIGILIGPMVVVFLQTLLNILHNELMAFEQADQGGGPRSPLPFILSLRQRRLRLPYPAIERIHRTS
jgi:predicted PurR-regulated permease PerM